MALRKASPLHCEAMKLLAREGPMQITELASRVMRFIPSSIAIRKRRSSVAILRKRRSFDAEGWGNVDEVAIGRRRLFRQWLRQARIDGNVTIADGVVSLSLIGLRRAEQYEQALSKAS